MLDCGQDRYSIMELSNRKYPLHPARSNRLQHPHSCEEPRLENYSTLANPDCEAVLMDLANILP